MTSGEERKQAKGSQVNGEKYYQAQNEHDEMKLMYTDESSIGVRAKTLQECCLSSRALSAIQREMWTKCESVSH